MPRTLADKRERWVFLAEEPADPRAVTPEEANGGIRAECKLLASGTRLSATSSDTVNEESFCESTNAPVPTRDNAEANFTPFRFLDPDTGLPVDEEDEVFSALIPKGAEVWVLKSKGPDVAAQFENGQPYDLFRVVMDNKQDPTERGGYIKDVIPGFVHAFWLNCVIGGGESS